MFPAIHQQAQFVFAPDEWSQSTRCRGCFEPPAYSAGLDYPVKLDRPFDPLERLRSAIFNHEQPRDQSMRGVGDNHRAWICSRLDPCGDIGRVAEKSVSLPAPAPTTTAPESIPILAASLGRVGCSLSLVIASRIARPARAARSASLSWASG